jgi:hypothetical protein
MEISSIKLDLAQKVFQVHGIRATGEVVIRKALGNRRCCHFSRSCARRSAKRSHVKPCSSCSSSRASSRRRWRCIPVRIAKADYQDFESQ